MMSFRDHVTLNRTLNWILSHQQEDGSFDEKTSCFHYQFCADEFRRESLTAIVLYSLTRDNSSDCMPELIRRRLFDGEQGPMMHAQRYLESHVPAVKPHLLPITLFETAFMQNRHIKLELRQKIHKALLSRKLTVMSEDNSKHLKKVDEKMSFDDQFLLNSMTIAFYTYFGDYRTAIDMTRWIVNEIQTHSHFDTMLEAIFCTESWFKMDLLFRKQFDMNKFDLTIDVSADNGEKKESKITSKNMDMTQY